MTGHIRKWANEYCSEIVKEPSRRSYSIHVTKFVEYIDSIGFIDRPYEIDLNNVSGSIEYYIGKGDINTQGSMKLHIQSIKDFYLFIQKKGWGGDIFSQKRYPTFLEEQILKYNLPIEMPRGFLNTETIIKIIKSLENELQKQEENSDFFNRWAILYLFIKLTLAAPARKGTICSLKLSNFSDDYEYFFLHSIKISISTQLQHQIIRFLKTKFKDITQIDRDQEIFTIIYGKKFKPYKLNGWLCSIIKKYKIYEIPKEKESEKIERISNTAIKTMIDNFINPAIISKVCGKGIGSLQEYYDEEFYTDNNFIIAEKYESELQSIDYFGIK